MAELKINFEKMAEGFIKTAKEKGMVVGWWVPVSERLPEEYCLFCDIDGDVFYGHIYDGRWWAEGQDDRIKNVVAWMPLPDPYRESEVSE